MDDEEGKEDRIFSLNGYQQQCLVERQLTSHLSSQHNRQIRTGVVEHNCRPSRLLAKAKAIGKSERTETQYNATV